MIGFVLFAMLGQEQVPPVGDLLSRMVVYGEWYRAMLPALECKEQIVSERLKKGAVRDETRMEGRLRLTREGTVVEPFRESHTWLTVNGRPVTAGETIRFPMFLSGAFANSVGFHEDALACFDWTVTRAGEGTDLLLTSRRKSVVDPRMCRDTTPQSVRVTTIDGEGSRVLRVGQTVPQKIADQRHQVHFAVLSTGRWR